MFQLNPLNKTSLSSIIQIPIFILSLFSCTDTSSLSNLKNDIPIIYELSCDAYNFRLHDRNSYHLGAVIGRGVSGVVYSLMPETSVSKNHVIKVQSRYNASQAYAAAQEEVLISRELPGLFVDTTYQGLYKLNPKGLKAQYNSLLLKQKVNGTTLYRLSRNIFFSYDFLREAYEKLVDFRFKLKQTLLVKLESEIFFWDLHSANIMYDIQKKEWLIVDANITKGIENLKMELSQYKKSKANFTHPIFKIADLLTVYDRTQKEAFIEEYLRIYLDSDMNLLRMQATP